MHASPLRPDATVAEIATGLPRSVRVFQQFGIDFCCGGKKRLAQACAELGVATDAVLAEIARLEAAPQSAPDWESAPLVDLVDHILAVHHRPLEPELQRIEAMARRVLYVHGAKDPERLVALVATFEALRDDLLPHMAKEETVLFPWIRDGRAQDATPAAELRAEMHVEHEAVGDLLRQLRALTDGYTPPMGACGTWRALYQGLGELEAELHQHIHLENNILFPRALA